jgi:hypothetical protein
MIERYSQRWIQGLERRKTMLPYSLVWCFLGLGLAFLFFGWIDRVWEYYLEGFFAVGTAVVLFIVETCWRRIVGTGSIGARVFFEAFERQLSRRR